MVRIRLRRVGGKNQASFRIVAADRESPRDGRFIEILGFYNPRTQPATINLKEDRIYHWIGNGAQPSDSAMQIFKSAGLLDRFERFKTGEKVEVLMAEAETAAQSRNTDRLTEHAAPAAGSSKRKLAAKAAAPAAAAVTPAAETPKAETPTVETPPAEAPQAETPPAESPPADEAPPAEAPPAEETPPAE